MFKFLYTLLFVLGISKLLAQDQQSKLSYSSVRSSINIKKKVLKNQVSSKEIDLDSVCRYFDNALVNDIIPFWYGTKWSFEGHTNKPNDGEIACGYFVSTTLKDVGLNINRYHLALSLIHI